MTGIRTGPTMSAHAASAAHANAAYSMISNLTATPANGAGPGLVL